MPSRRLSIDCTPYRRYFGHKTAALAGDYKTYLNITIPRQIKIEIPCNKYLITTKGYGDGLSHSKTPVSCNVASPGWWHAPLLPGAPG